jgi:hypothetical protein
VAASSFFQDPVKLNSELKLPSGTVSGKPAFLLKCSAIYQQQTHHCQIKSTAAELRTSTRIRIARHAVSKRTSRSKGPNRKQSLLTFWKLQTKGSSTKAPGETGRIRSGLPRYCSTSMAKGTPARTAPPSMVTSRARASSSATSLPAPLQYSRRWSPAASRPRPTACSAASRTELARLIPDGPTPLRSSASGFTRGGDRQQGWRLSRQKLLTAATAIDRGERKRREKRGTRFLGRTGVRRRPTAAAEVAGFDWFRSISFVFFFETRSISCVNRSKAIAVKV